MTGRTVVPAVPDTRRGYWFLALQLLLAGSVLCYLLLRPQVGAPMLLIPIVPADAGAATRFALANDARLLGTGPLPGSIVVRGDQGRVSHAAWSAGLLVTAAVGGCGRERTA